MQRKMHTSPLFSASLLSLLLEYRLALQIAEKIILSDGSYYICPRCKVSLDRDYQNFCDRCGQCLAWTGCRNAKVIYPGNKST